MAEQRRHEDREGGFDVVVPAGWQAAPDPEEGGIELSHPDGAGALHLIGFPQEGDEFPDPADELYAFLQERDVELEEDEVEDLPLDGDAEMSVCEFIAEDEEEGEPTFWLVGVATAPGRLVFATYVCAAGEEEQERQTVLDTLATLRLHPVD
jgi:hypothetical protein